DAAIHDDVANRGAQELRAARRVPRTRGGDAEALEPPRDLSEPTLGCLGERLARDLEQPAWVREGRFHDAVGFVEHRQSLFRIRGPRRAHGEHANDARVVRLSSINGLEESRSL